MTKSEWKARFIKRIKGKMVGEWPEEDKNQVAHDAAGLCWFDSENGEIKPEEMADDEAEEMARE